MTILCNFWHSAIANTNQAAANQNSPLPGDGHDHAQNNDQEKERMDRVRLSPQRRIDENRWIEQICSCSNQRPWGSCDLGQKDQDREACEKIIADGQELEPNPQPNFGDRWVLFLQGRQLPFRDPAEDNALVGEQWRVHREVRLWTPFSLMGYTVFCWIVDVGDVVAHVRFEARARCEEQAKEERSRQEHKG